MITAVCARSLKERGSSVWFLDYTACKCNWMQPCAARYAGPPQLYAVPAWLHEWRIWRRGLEAPSADVSWCQLRSFVGRSQIRIARFMNAKNAEGAMAEIGGPRPRPQGMAKDADWRPSITYPKATCGNIWNQRIDEYWWTLLNIAIAYHCHFASARNHCPSPSPRIHCWGSNAAAAHVEHPSRHLLGLPGGGLEFNIVWQFDCVTEYWSHVQ